MFIMTIFLMTACEESVRTMSPFEGSWIRDDGARLIFEDNNIMFTIGDLIRTGTFSFTVTNVTVNYTRESNDGGNTWTSNIFTITVPYNFSNYGNTLAWGANIYTRQ